MKQTLFLVFLSLVGCTSSRAPSPALKTAISSRQGCVLVYDLERNKYVAKIGESCGTRLAPHSSFKIPLALMAFESGVLKDESSSRKWDGQKKMLKAWEKNHTAQTWMSDSVVWFSQRLTQEMGMEKVKSDLARYQYGNQDMSGGLTEAWLGRSLQISPLEQIDFLRRAWGRELASEEATQKMLAILPLADVQDGVLKGKTGSSGLYSMKPLGTALIGWYIGYYTYQDKTFAVSSSYQDKAKDGESDRPGLIALEQLKKVLSEKALFE